MCAKSSEGNYYHREQKLDDGLQAELDAALGDLSIEDILEAEKADESPGTRATGEGVRRGRVVSIQGDDLFVNMGGRSEGVLPADQFSDEPLPAIGDLVEVVISGYDASEGLLRLSRQGAVLAAAWETLQEGQVVEGRVTGHNKGGLEVDVQGIRAFMPVSQIERFRVDDLTQYVNQKLRCCVSEVNHADNNVVLSRRDLLDAEAEAAAKELRGKLAEGKIVTGTVRSIMPYGAFVDIGGVDGLLHVSDMSHARVDKPEDIVHEGQTVEVMILKIDTESNRISLGLKQTQADPWLGAEQKWPVDSVVGGRVTRLADFGAFFELEPGVEGLIPIGEITFERRINHPSEVIAEGDAVRVRVLSVDPEKKRISLSLKRAGDDPWMGAAGRWPVESTATGIITRLAEFGAFIELSPGVEGLCHISELSDTHVRAAGEVVKEGQTVKAKVLEVDEDRRRISLSIKALTTAPEYTGAASGADFEPEEPAAPRAPRKTPLKGGLDSGSADLGGLGKLNMG